MKPHHLVIAFSAVFLLSACQHTQYKDTEAAMTPGQPNPVVPVPAPGTVMPTPMDAPRNWVHDVDISDASNESVTVFSLDTVAPIGPGPAPKPLQYDNMTTVPNNDSVFVDPSYQIAQRSGMVMTQQGYVPQRAENQVFFKYGSSRLGSIDQRKIATFADQAKFAPVKRVTVEGYASRPTQAGTGTVQSHILNLKESMNRSFAVSKSLMQKGLPAEKIKTVSYGSTRATGDGSFDRRVDMIMGER